jgi:hypothetical protein
MPRRVTAKPPNTLIEATSTATAASTVTTVLPCPSCSSAPTTMIPEIAFVTDMSGVWSAWCTCPMT